MIKLTIVANLLLLLAGSSPMIIIQMIKEARQNEWQAGRGRREEPD